MADDYTPLTHSTRDSVCRALNLLLAARGEGHSDGVRAAVAALQTAGLDSAAAWSIASAPRAWVWDAWRDMAFRRAPWERDDYASIQPLRYASAWPDY